MSRDGWVSEIFASFQGEGLFAGHRHLFLRLAGCNLRCRYCDTPASLVRTPECEIHHGPDKIERIANPLPADMIAKELGNLVRQDEGVRALAVTGGEPAMQAEFLTELLSTWAGGVDVLLETNATYPERLEQLLPHVQILSADLKLPSNSGEPPLWDQHRRFLEIGRAVSHRYVKIPVDEETSEEELEHAASLVAEISVDTPVFLTPISSPAGGLMVSASRLRRFYDIVTARLPDVRVMPQAHLALGIP